MDLLKLLEELRTQKKHIDQTIAMLEQLHIDGVASPTNTPVRRGSSRPKRSGRKSMDAEERKEVSIRMRRYWENRRKRL
jgi:hypothetical protein